jgi:hypothetical protein
LQVSGSARSSGRVSGGFFVAVDHLRTGRTGLGGSASASLAAGRVHGSSAANGVVEGTSAMRKDHAAAGLRAVLGPGYGGSGRFLTKVFGYCDGGGN